MTCWAQFFSNKTTRLSICIYKQVRGRLLLALRLPLLLILSAGASSPCLEVAEALHILRLFFGGTRIFEDVGRQEAVNEVDWVKRLGQWNEWEARASCRAWTCCCVAWRLNLLLCLREGGGFLWAGLEITTTLLICTEYKVLIFLALAQRLRRKRIWGLFRPGTVSNEACPSHFLLSERFLLSQLLLKFIRDLALQTQESSTEVGEDIRRAEAVAGRVIGGVHGVLDNEVMLVHLLQLVEWPKHIVQLIPLFTNHLILTSYS